MKNRMTSKLERSKIVALARYYANKDYEVFANLPGYLLPQKFEDFRPDLVVKKADETIIFEVTTAEALSKNRERVSKLADFANNTKGTRFDLIMVSDVPAKEQFVKLRDSVASDLTITYTHYEIWKQLFPNKQTVRSLNKFKVFFHYTIAAHLQLFILFMTRVTKDSKNLSSRSLPGMIEMIERYPDLVPTISKSEIVHLREVFDTHNNTIRNIRYFRDKRIVDANQRVSWQDNNIWQDTAITVGEAGKLLEDLVEIFNIISGAYDGRSYSMRTLGINDTTALLKDLSNGVIGGVNGGDT